MLENYDPAADRFLELPIEHGKAHFSEGFATVFQRRHWRHCGIGAELLAIFGEAAGRQPLHA